MKESDFDKINGIFLYYNDVTDYEQERLMIPIPWYSTEQAYQMELPNLYLNTAKFTDSEDWLSDLKLFTGIKSFYSHSETFKIDFLSEFKSLQELYLYKAIISDWSFLLELKSLSMVFINKCGDRGNEIVKYLSQLYVSNICIKYAGINDLTPLSNMKILSELNLGHNEIEDLTPIMGNRCYYLTLRWNKIKDITPLSKVDSYMMNLRHNRIEDCITMVDKIKARRIRRCFLKYNNLPDEQVQGLKRLNEKPETHLVVSDFEDM